MIQAGGVRTTPGKAVGFLFIPFFNLYWVFTTYVGLAKDWNRVMASYPNLAHGPRLSTGLMTTYAIFWCIWFIGFITGLFSAETSPDSFETMEAAGSSPLDMIFGVCNLAKFVIELIVFHGICKCINFMGRLHMMPGGGMGGPGLGVAGAMPGQPVAGQVQQQPGAGIRLY